MENRLSQRRVSFSEPQSQKYTRDDELVTAVAAAAFAIHSLEETRLLNLRKMKESPKISRDLIVSGIEEKNMSRKLSHGETSMKRSSFGQYPPPRKPESASFLERRPSGLSPAAGYQIQNQKGIPIQNKSDKARAEAWEKAKIERIHKRYGKIKSKILSWDSEKKIEAKLHMEKKKIELERRREMEMLHYKNKIARIDMITKGAMTQLEDHKRKEESKAREKAKKVQKTGQVPVKCFCFKSF